MQIPFFWIHWDTKNSDGTVGESWRTGLLNFKTDSYQDFLNLNFAQSPGGIELDVFYFIYSENSLITQLESLFFTHTLDEILQCLLDIPQNLMIF